MNDKAKAILLDKLVEIYNSPMSQTDICLSVIAICMLESIPTTEELTRHGSTHQSQFCEQGSQVRSSEQ